MTSAMTNRIEGSPVRLEEDREASRAIPELPYAVLDAFGEEAQIALHRGRFSALAPRKGKHRFLLYEGEALVPTGVRSAVTYGQTLERDPAGRSLVIGGEGELLYAVERSGEALCLGQLPEPGRIESACWLEGGGVAFLLGGRIHVHRPGQGGVLAEGIRFDPEMEEVWGLRVLPLAADSEAGTEAGEGNGVEVIAAAADQLAALWSVDREGQVRLLARWDDLDLAELRLFLDETGERWMLPEGAQLAVGGAWSRLEGLADAVAMRGRLPEVATELAPALLPGESLSPPSGDAAPKPTAPKLLPDAAEPPSLDRLGPLTAAFVRMLRAARKRPSPDEALLALIRADTPDDLRAYLHAWAVHAPNHPSVYEFWAAAPKKVTDSFLRKQVKEGLQLGSYASGEPILASRRGGSATEVVMIDEEGYPYRYRGLEGFFTHLQERHPAGEPFELDEWME